MSGDDNGALRKRVQAIDLPGRQRVVRIGLAIGAPALFFAVTSPYNAVTYLPFFARLFYWAYLIGLSFTTLAWLSRRAGPTHSRWLIAAAASLLATPLVLVNILVIQHLIGYAVPAYEWLQLSASIWVINLVLTLFWTGLLYPDNEIDHRPANTDTDTDSEHPLRERLPADARDLAVLALSAQDHYVTVHLPGARHLVHMRFADAMHAMRAVDGLQVHRSWWVSRAGVQSIQRDNRRWVIQLTSGEAVPVSRSGATRLKEAGWR